MPRNISYAVQSWPFLFKEDYHANSQICIWFHGILRSSFLIWVLHVFFKLRFVAYRILTIAVLGCDLYDSHKDVANYGRRIFAPQYGTIVSVQIWIGDIRSSGLRPDLCRFTCRQLLWWWQQLSYIQITWSSRQISLKLYRKILIQNNKHTAALLARSSVAEPVLFWSAPHY